LNMGDSYCGCGTGHKETGKAVYEGGDYDGAASVRTKIAGMKSKDMIGIPWMVAFALRADGWYLRSDIIWSKPNPMPESVTDRPTKSHEYVFLLTKKARYYYDADAIREPHKTFEQESKRSNFNDPVYYDEKAPDQVGKSRIGRSRNEDFNSAGRNRRTVWEIATQPFPEAHFATFPEALVEPCIKAGTSERGCCAKCGAPWERLIEKDNTLAESRRGTKGYESRGLEAGNRFASETPGYTTISKTLGWQPTCKCNSDIVPCVVLDPFMGSGTTLKVARDLKRDAIGIEISPEYVKIARERLRLNEQLLCGVTE
jgi:hypothetical protein